jgi:phage regulator Rha-like protein
MTNNNVTVVSVNQNFIENKILTIRGQHVMMDSDLAEMFDTETKFINRAVKRNQKRFPDIFVFQLTDREWENLRFQIGTSSLHGGRRTTPYVFTEQGVVMLSGVLNTDVAIQISVKIVQAFVKMRQFLIQNASIFQRLDYLELNQLKNEEKFDRIFKALDDGKAKPEKGIFFDGQIFDALVFVAELIKSAQKEIILIDNYIDETVLLLLDKRSQGVKANIYTKTITKSLTLDIEKHNSQYASITVSEFKNSHDRFIIIDRKELYHIGASLKDLGKKWFAFSKMNINLVPIFKELNIQ